LRTATAHTFDASLAGPDSSLLEQHVRSCDQARGRAFALHCAGEWLHDLLGPRLVTTVLAATLLMLMLTGTN
jgi:hypothetical protein